MYLKVAFNEKMTNLKSTQPRKKSLSCIQRQWSRNFFAWDIQTVVDTGASGNFTENRKKFPMKCKNSPECFPSLVRINNLTIRVTYKYIYFFCKDFPPDWIGQCYYVMYYVPSAWPSAVFKIKKGFILSSSFFQQVWKSARTTHAWAFKRVTIENRLKLNEIDAGEGGRKEGELKLD